MGNNGTYIRGGFVVGPQVYPQARWFAGRVPQDSEKLLYSQSWILTAKGYRLKPVKGKGTWGKVRLPTSRCPFPAGPMGVCSMLSATAWGHVWSVVSQGSSAKLWSLELTGVSHRSLQPQMTDLSYSDFSCPFSQAKTGVHPKCVWSN